MIKSLSWLRRLKPSVSHKFKTLLILALVSMQGRSVVSSSRKRHLSLSHTPHSNAKLAKMGEQIEVLPTPIKSESDKKEYRLILLPNGLKALLVDSTLATPVASEDDSEEEESEESGSEEDEEPEGEGEDNENMAACSLMIDVGSFSDPRRIQGLAHFLEHMIFMGSEKYPQENEFDSFINKCGGSDNADTDCEETSFYFEVTEKHLEGALDRFSALFKAPLMSRDAMAREKEAVDSEFQTKINHEGSRKEQLLASLGNEGHPCSIFTWGNLKTLKEGIEDDELYAAVHAFRKKHYSAHRMSVCLQARLPLDDLQSLVERHFLGIPRNDDPGEDFSSFSASNAFRPEFSSKVFYIKAKSDVNALDLTWVIPPLMDKYRTKPEESLSFVLGHEGAGSLCAYLRRNLLALEVQAGAEFSGFENNSMYALFSITIVLTEKGLLNVEQVLRAVFAYLRMLKHENESERIFDEMQMIERNKFRFETEKQALDNVEEFVTNMKYYEPEDILGGPSLLYVYDKAQIHALIESLNTRTFNTMITSLKPLPNVSYDQKEPWFGTEYGTVDFPWTELWQSQEIIEFLHLPAPNEFVVSNFDILEHEDVPKDPQRIFSSPVSELWYRQDDKFLLPHAFVNIYLRSDLPRRDARSMALLNLTSLVLKFYLVEELYPATMAGLSYQMYGADLGLVLKASGFSEKIDLIVEKYGRVLKRLPEIMEKGVVEVIGTQMRKNLYNTMIRPKALAKDLRLETLQEVHFTSYEKYEASQSVTFEDLRAFCGSLVANLSVQALIQGNISKEKSTKIIQNLEESLKCGPLATPLTRRTRKIPVGEKYIRAKSLRKADVNTSVINYYQIGPSSVLKTATLDLLISLMEEPLFDILRTKEQLGYDVSCDVKDTFGVLGYTICVLSQENKHSALSVDEKIEVFRQDFVRILSEMDQDDFETARQSLIKLKALPDTELKEEVERGWAEVTEEEYIFDRRWREVEALKTLSKADVEEFYRGTLGSQARKLSVQVVGDSEKEAEDDNEEEEELPTKLELLPQVDGLDMVHDLEAFRDQLEIYPVIKTAV